MNHSNRATPRSEDYQHAYLPRYTAPWQFASTVSRIDSPHDESPADTTLNFSSHSIPEHTFLELGSQHVTQQQGHGLVRTHGTIGPQTENLDHLNPRSPLPVEYQGLYRTDRNIQTQPTSPVPEYVLSPSLGPTSQPVDFEPPSETYRHIKRRKGRGVASTHNNTGLQHEKLDPSYHVRHSSYFEFGRVFAVLFTEPASENARVTDSNNSFTPTRFGGIAFTQIRRFVVMRQRKEFCFACPILTYANRGTLKAGVNPEQHAIAYTQGHSSEPLPGEHLSKNPIEIVPSQGAGALHATSRIYFGIHYPIQYNVKVKDLGYVHPRCTSDLLDYWIEENGGLELGRDLHVSDGRTQSAKEINTRPILHFENLLWDSATSLKPEDGVSLGGTTQVAELSKVPGPLDARYEFISNPRAFFKKGRVFMTLWAEPKGHTESEKLEGTVNQQAFVEVTRFAVIRAKATHCLCFRISTYSGQGTTKPGVVAQDHAAVIPVNGSFLPHPAEETLTKTPIQVKVEDEAVTIDPMSRINFAKIYTVEYNIRVRNVGRVVGESVHLLDEYFAASLGLTR